MNNDIPIKDAPGMVKRGDAIISTDKEGMEAYKRQKKFYRRVDDMELKIEFLEARIKYLEEMFVKD